MRVKTTQLIPGCILLKNVFGPSGKVLIPENTILTERHITVLKNFLIDFVDISRKLQNGDLFQPNDVDEKIDEKINIPQLEDQPFDTHYIELVQRFKKMFLQWEKNIAVNVPLLYRLMNPLFNRLEEIGSEVFRIQKYSTKEDYLYHHCVAISLLATYIGKKMGLPENEQIELGMAALLSDSGMSKLDHFYKEDRPLSEDEINKMKQHPIYSYRMVERDKTLPKHAKMAMLQHHERIDGTGYPLGLKKDEIHPFAQVIAVCDVYHAITCERSFVNKKSPFKAIEELQKKQFSRLDPEIVMLFIDSLTNFSVGTQVKLSNNKIGEVVFINKNKPTRPMVKIIKDDEIIVLENEPHLFIEEVVEIE